MIERARRTEEQRNVVLRFTFPFSPFTQRTAVSQPRLVFNNGIHVSIAMEFPVWDPWSWIPGVEERGSWPPCPCNGGDI